MVTVDELRAKKFIGGNEVEGPNNFDPLKSGSDLLGTPVAPKVTATTQQPVVTRTPGAVEKQPASYDFSDLQSFSPEQLQDFVDQQQIRAMNGQRLTEEDQARLMKASRLMGQSMLPQGVEPTIDQQRIRRAEQLKRDTERRLTQERLKNMREYESLENKQFRQRETELQEQAGRLKDASQQALSFSGFGRSTYAADQASKIQQQTNQALNVLAAERDLRIRAEEARARGADEEVLARMDEAIMNLQQQSFEQQLAIAEQLNEFNMQNTQSYEEKINNILAFAQQYQDDSELTEDELALADAYAGLLIDMDGNINTKLLEKLPPRLVGASLKNAAELRSNFGADDEFAVSGGVIFNKNTGEYEKITDPKFSAHDGYLYNEETGEYEKFGSKENNFNTGFVEGIGTGQVTAYGTEANPYGLDIDGNKGDPINTPVGGKVVEVGNDPDGFGNYVILMDDEGNRVRYAHLDSIDVEEEANILAGEKIGTIGNTGYVIPMNGGDGTHTDITLFDSNGRERSPQEAEQYLNSKSSSSTLSPIAQAVIDGGISEDKIKDNVKNKEDVPAILAEVQRFRRENTDTTEVDQETDSLLDVLERLRDIPRGKRIAANTTESRALWGQLGPMVSVFAPGAVDIKSGFNRIRDTLTLDYLVDLKKRGATFGALSEMELKKIAGAISELDLDQSDAAWKREIDRVVEQLKEGKDRIGAEEDPLSLGI